jgi:hypothetical protein
MISSLLMNSNIPITIIVGPISAKFDPFVVYLPGKSNNGEKKISSKMIFNKE